MGSKITIGQARPAGADGLLAICVGAPVTSGGCRHSSEITMLLGRALGRGSAATRYPCGARSAARARLRLGPLTIIGPDVGAR